jgi:hypothetical protein
VWVLSLEGGAQVAVEDGAEPIALTAGQAAAFVEGADVPLPVEVDRAAVLAWLDDLAEGEDVGDIATVAFRCVVGEAGMTLLAAPDEAAEAVGGPLRSGAVVVVDGRTEDGQYLLVRPLTGRDSGWAPAEGLRCVGPVALLVVAETEPSETEEPTATAPRRVIYVTATPPLVVGTPTATATAAQGDYKIRFWTDDDSIAKGTCTVLRWETENISEVFYQGRGVVGNGSADECPEKTTTYELKVILRDGRQEVHTVKVTVREPERTPEPTAAPPTAEPPTAEQPTAEPPTAEQPTAEPTVEPTSGAPSP